MHHPLPGLAMRMPPITESGKVADELKLVKQHAAVGVPIIIPNHLPHNGM